MAHLKYYSEAILMASISRAFRGDQQIWSIIKNFYIGNSRLSFAAFKGDLSRVKFLVNIGSDANMFRAISLSPLFVSLKNGYLDVAKVLINSGANVNYVKPKCNTSCLMVASQNNNLDIAKLLISRGADVNARISINGTTSLMLASKFGHLELVRTLLDNGAEIEAAVSKFHEEGKTSLMFATVSCHLDIVRLLLERGSNPDVIINVAWSKDFGKCALDFASSEVEFFVTQGVSGRKNESRKKRAMEIHDLLKSKKI